MIYYYKNYEEKEVLYSTNLALAVLYQESNERDDVLCSWVKKALDGEFALLREALAKKGFSIYSLDKCKASYAKSWHDDNLPCPKIEQEYEYEVVNV